MQMERILGISANDLFATRNTDEATFQTVVATAQGHPHLFRIAWKSRRDLKTDELRLRHTVIALHKFDWATEAKTMLESVRSLL